MQKGEENSQIWHANIKLLMVLMLQTQMKPCGTIDDKNAYDFSTIASALKNYARWCVQLLSLSTSVKRQVKKSAQAFMVVVSRREPKARKARNSWSHFWAGSLIFERARSKVRSGIPCFSCFWAGSLIFERARSFLRAAQLWDERVATVLSFMRLCASKI